MTLTPRFSPASVTLKADRAGAERQHCQRFEEGPLIDFVASYLEDVCGVSELKLAVSARGRAVATDYLRALAA